MYRIVPKEEVIQNLKKDYSDYEIEIIFAYHKDYPIEEHDNDGKYRWVQKLNWQNTPGMNPNDIADKYYSGEMTQEEYMDYNREIGYSLYGYWEIFVFNDRFDEEQYRKDMADKIGEEREEIINDLLND